MNKILFVTNDFGPRAGGIETFIMGLIQRLPKDRIIVYTSAQGDTREYDEKWKRDFGVIVHRDRAKILLPTPRVAKTLGALVRSQSASIACFGASAPLGLLAPALRRAGICRIISLTHGHEVWWAKVPPFSVALRRIGNSIDVMTYLGDFTRKAISQALQKEAKDAMVKIAPGIDLNHFSPVGDDGQLRKTLGLSEKKVIVSVGRLVHRKGQDRLIAALPKIRKSVPGAHLLLIGEGPHYKKLVSLAHKYGVVDAVTFIGRLEYAQLPAYIRVGDIFAMPARSRFWGLEVEGLGIVYLEASACGLAVVAGNSGGAPDAVLDGITGVVVDGNDLEGIAKSVIALLQDPARAQKMGIAGRRWITQEWSWDKWSGAFAQVLGI